MQNLEVLIVDDEIICSENTVTSCLPSSLRWIEWRNYPSSSLPERLEPSNLVGIVLFRSRIVQLWPISKKLSNLKHLDLSDSLGLIKTSNFGDMPNLERLNLWWCLNLEEVHPSLGHCRMLTHLCLYGCVKLKNLPKFVTMESLECLNLLYCTSLAEFPEICGDMWHLSEFYVGSEVLESIPDAIRSLVSLKLFQCNKLTMLPNSLFESQQLEYLQISYCSRLVELPISLGVQKKLCRLGIDGCENLNKLPSSIQMELLYELNISNCPKLDTFPEINGVMHRLTKLTLNSTGIRQLPSSIGNLSGLSELNISNCPKLDTFPEINGVMHRLVKLTLNSTGIRELPSSIENLRHLFSLFLNDCEDLVSLTNSSCNLMNLRHLYLCGCKKLEKLPENIGDLQELSVLATRETAISQPPTSITKLGKLRKLRFSHVLGGLPEDLGSLRYLQSLDVSGSRISCLPESIKELLHLQHLNIQFCQNLSELPGEPPPNLELSADYHLALSSIRDLVNKYLKLHMLSISWCGHEKSECETVSTEQVNVMKLLQHFLRTCIQCDFNQRAYFLISFPEVRILELFDYQFMNQKRISINLNPSWYTNKFMGFSICYCPNEMNVVLEATLVCKYDPKGKHSLYYDIDKYGFDTPVMCFLHIPFETLWHASGNKEGKNPNDYYLFEVSELYGTELCWGIRMEYENKDRR